MPRTQPQPTPADPPRRASRTPRHRHIAPGSAPSQSPGDPADLGGPGDAGTRPHSAPALALPTLAAIRPLLYTQDVETYEEQHQGRLQAQSLYASLIRTLLGSLSPMPISPDDDLVERLHQALEALSPMADWGVEVQPGEHGGFEFRIEAHPGSYANLSRLHGVLQRLDDRVLPGILHAIERLSYGVAPSVGPHGAEGYAEYWWSLDRLSECELPERFEKDYDFTTRQTLVLARRLGLSHQWQVRDMTPWPYFRYALDTGGTIDLLEALGASPRAERMQPVLLQVAGLLREGLTLRAQLPVMTDQEDEQCSSLLPAYTVYGVVPGAQCAVYEVMNEFLRYYMEGGEHEPCMVLHVDERPETHARLVQYLRVAPQLLQVLDRLQRVLVEAEAQC